MISKEQLKYMCIPPGPGKAYYRPLICNGDLDKVDIFLVGTNPATPIFPDQMNIDSYVDMLLNYEDFIRYYKENRENHGEKEVSRTRIGMNSFLSWLSNHTESPVVETEAIPYPTAKLNQLNMEPRFVIEKGMDVFFQMVDRFQPGLLILHGKKTVEHVAYTLIGKGLIKSSQVDLDRSIKEMEAQSPIAYFTYPNGKTGVIMACRHFMYYGSSGNSFESFRQKVLGVINQHLYK